MRPRRHPARTMTRGAVCCAAALALLAACETPRPSGRCAYVETHHLSVPRNMAGRSLICDPRRVSPAHRNRYFPGYQWGDETW